MTIKIREYSDGDVKKLGVYEAHTESEVIEMVYQAAASDNRERYDYLIKLLMCEEWFAGTDQYALKDSDKIWVRRM